MHKLAFQCGLIGVFEWVVMPFSLKNVKAIYQRAMNAIFRDMIGRFIEVYIIVIKGQDFKEHLVF